MAAAEIASAAGDVWLARAFAESLLIVAEEVTVQRASDGTIYCARHRDFRGLSSMQMAYMREAPVAITDTMLGILQEQAGLDAEQKQT